MKLGLGTVQFGLDYGVTNKSGIPDSDEVFSIIEYADSKGINCIDTASLYGESEKVLGTCLGDGNFKIITKSPKFISDCITNKDIDLLNESFNKSCSNLKRNKIYGLLIHNPEDLLKKGGERIYEKLVEYKIKNKVSKIGFSAYNSINTNEIIDRYNIDLVQIPVNIFNQKMINDGTLHNLKEKNIEVHARSIFLQGVLLIEPNQMPQKLLKLKKSVEKYREILKQNNITPLQASIGFIKKIKEIDVAIIGVLSKEQLEDIINAYYFKCEDISFLSELSLDDSKLINPANWT